MGIKWQEKIIAIEKINKPFNTKNCRILNLFGSLLFNQNQTNNTMTTTLIHKKQTYIRKWIIGGVALLLTTAYAQETPVAPNSIGGSAKLTQALSVSLTRNGQTIGQMKANPGTEVKILAFVGDKVKILVSGETMLVGREILGLSPTAQATPAANPSAPSPANSPFAALAKPATSTPSSPTNVNPSEISCTVIPTDTEYINYIKQINFEKSKVSYLSNREFVYGNNGEKIESYLETTKEGLTSLVHPLLVTASTPRTISILYKNIKLVIPTSQIGKYIVEAPFPLQTNSEFADGKDDFISFATRKDEYICVIKDPNTLKSIDRPGLNRMVETSSHPDKYQTHKCDGRGKVTIHFGRVPNYEKLWYPQLQPPPSNINQIKGIWYQYMYQISPPIYSECFK